MPRKDPLIGVEVMTWGEFWQKEGEYEGKPIEEVLEEHFAQIEQANRKEEETLRENALSTLQDAALSEEEAPMPIALLRVKETSSDGYLRSSAQRLVAVCWASDGKVYEFTFTSSYYAGSFYEQSEQDERLEWHPVTFGITLDAWRYGQSLKFIIGPWEGVWWWSQTYHPGPTVWGSALWPWWKKLIHGRLIGCQIQRR